MSSHGKPEATPSRRAWLRHRLGGRTWLYLVLTVGSSISAIIEPSAQPWQRVLVAGFVPLVVWGVLVRHERPLVLPLVAIAMAATCTDAVLPVAMFALVLRRRDRITAVVTALAVAVAIAALTLELYPSTMGAGLTFEDQAVPVPDSLEVPLQVAADVALLVALPMLLAGLLAQRRALLASLEDRARRAEDEHELRAAQAVADERQRLAAEMHDVVGHKLALISMQAGALEVNPDATADVVVEQAAAVRVAAGEAQTELRALLDVMQRDDAPLAPQPGFGEIPALIAGAQEAGAAVSLAVEVDGDPAPAVGRTAHRIVREGLTNALGHSPGSPVDVSITGDGRGGLTVEVMNVLPPPATAPRDPDRAGTGLASLAERLRVLGGTFEAGPTGDRWVLRAVLPAHDAAAGRSPATEEVADR